MLTGKALLLLTATPLFAHFRPVCELVREALIQAPRATLVMRANENEVRREVSDFLHSHIFFVGIHGKRGDFQLWDPDVKPEEAGSPYRALPFSVLLETIRANPAYYNHRALFCDVCFSTRWPAQEKPPLVQLADATGKPVYGMVGVTFIERREEKFWIWSQLPGKSSFVAETRAFWLAIPGETELKSARIEDIFQGEALGTRLRYGPIEQTF